MDCGGGASSRDKWWGVSREFLPSGLSLAVFPRVVYWGGGNTSHFTDKETEAQRGKETQQRQTALEAELEGRSLAPWPGLTVPPEGGGKMARPQPVLMGAAACLPPRSPRPSCSLNCSLVFLGSARSSCCNNSIWNTNGLSTILRFLA